MNSVVAITCIKYLERLLDLQTEIGHIQLPKNLFKDLRLQLNIDSVEHQINQFGKIID